MSTPIPLTTLASRITALGAMVNEIKAEYEYWLEAVQNLEHILSTTVEKLECASDDLWSIEIDGPTGEHLVVVAPPAATGASGRHALTPGACGHPLSPSSFEDEVPF